jgi:hypothetical protein
MGRSTEDSEQLNCVQFNKSIEQTPITVGAAEGCDLLILIFLKIAEDQDQKIAAFGSSYGARITRAAPGPGTPS